MEKEKIVQVASQIRQFLIEEFPECIDLKNQCKRASILFDLYCKQNKVKSSIRTGYITKEKNTFPKVGILNLENQGHMWNIIQLDKEEYVLDSTLSQFKTLLNKEIPSNVFGK